MKALATASDGLHFAHAFRAPVVKCLRRYAMVSAGTHECRVVLAADSDRMQAPTLVLGLLLRSRPSHIAGLIVSIAVDSVYGVVPAWSMTDIFEKVSKGFPSFAASYAATSVKPPARVLRIRASAPHCNPCAIKAPGLRVMLRASRRVAMLCSRRRRPVHAPAAADSPLSHSREHPLDFGSAMAPEQPEALPASLSGKADRGQICIRFASDINWECHEPSKCF